MGIAELTRNAVDVLPRGGLEAKLAQGRPLRVKLGIDVTSPDIHVGRAVMEHYGADPQVVLTTPLLLSWDGEKMSSSQGNNIPLLAAPEQMFGRTMRIPDSLLPEWYRLVAERPVPAGDPMEAKLELARLIVRRSHGEEAIRAAEEHFTRVVRRHEAPEEVPEAPLPDGDPLHLPKLLAENGLAPSTSEARRLIAQGAVKVDGEPVADLDLAREKLKGALVQSGKRRFVRFA
jgi:tyrosyl-tRNA synthetase